MASAWQPRPARAASPAQRPAKLQHLQPKKAPFPAEPTPRPTPSGAGRRTTDPTLTALQAKDRGEASALTHEPGEPVGADAALERERWRIRTALNQAAEWTPYSQALAGENLLRMKGVTLDCFPPLPGLAQTIAETAAQRESRHLRDRLFFFNPCTRERLDTAEAKWRAVQDINVRQLNSLDVHLRAFLDFARDYKSRYRAWPSATEIDFRWLRPGRPTTIRNADPATWMSWFQYYQGHIAHLKRRAVDFGTHPTLSPLREQIIFSTQPGAYVDAWLYLQPLPEAIVPMTEQLLQGAHQSQVPVSVQLPNPHTSRKTWAEQLSRADVITLGYQQAHKPEVWALVRELATKWSHAVPASHYLPRFSVQVRAGKRLWYTGIGSADDPLLFRLAQHPLPFTALLAKILEATLMQMPHGQIEASAGAVPAQVEDSFRRWLGIFGYDAVHPFWQAPLPENVPEIVRDFVIQLGPRINEMSLPQFWATFRGRHSAAALRALPHWAED